MARPTPRERLLEVVKEVQEADDKTLVTTFASLTHIMHSARTSDREHEFRVQRDQVEDEILRRMAPCVKTHTTV